MLARIMTFARSAAIVFAIVLATTAFAQEDLFAPTPGAYVGLNGGALWNLDLDFPPILCFGVQAGDNIAPNFAVRGFGDVLPAAAEALAFRVAADALYTGEVAASTSGYLGAGGGILIDTTPSTWFPVVPEVHLTGGVEYRIIDEVGVYAELQAMTPVFIFVPLPVFRAGVNYYF